MVLRYCEVAPHWLPGIRAKDQKGEISLSFGSLVNYHMYDFLQRSNLEKHNNSQERFQAGTANSEVQNISRTSQSRGQERELSFYFQGQK